MYPPIKPYKAFHMHVDDIGDQKVEVYVQLSGNPRGIPVVYLHGGPGDHAEPEIRQLFNPRVYHILQFDQRGCGRSRPANHVRKNTTQLLLKDIEAIRHYVNADKLVVAGGSWGTTLALAYAIKYPCLGLILRGVYDLSKGPDKVLGYMYPDLEDSINKLTRGRSSAQMLRSHTRKAYMKMTNDPRPMYVTSPPHGDDLKTLLNLTLVGNHYDHNNFFLTKRAIYRGLKRITCPVFIVQGRYDLVTPPVMAYNICQKLKQCDLRFVSGGHTYHDLVDGLIKASDELAKKISVV